MKKKKKIILISTLIGLFLVLGTILAFVFIPSQTVVGGTCIYNGQTLSNGQTICNGYIQITCSNGQIIRNVEEDNACSGKECDNPAGFDGYYLCKSANRVYKCIDNNWDSYTICESGKVCTEGTVLPSNPCYTDSNVGKTCSERGGLVCKSNEYCTSLEVVASDTNQVGKCCLSRCLLSDGGGSGDCIYNTQPLSNGQTICNGYIQITCSNGQIIRNVEEDNACSGKECDNPPGFDGYYLCESLTSVFKCINKEWTYDSECQNKQICAIGTVLPDDPCYTFSGGTCEERGGLLCESDQYCTSLEVHTDDTEKCCIGRCLSEGSLTVSEFMSADLNQMFETICTSGCNSREGYTTQCDKTEFSNKIFKDILKEDCKAFVNHLSGNIPVFSNLVSSVVCVATTPLSLIKETFNIGNCVATPNNIFGKTWNGLVKGIYMFGIPRGYVLTSTYIILTVSIILLILFILWVILLIKKISR